MVIGTDSVRQLVIHREVFSPESINYITILHFPIDDYIKFRISVITKNNTTQTEAAA